MNESPQPKKPQMRVACYCRVATSDQLSEPAIEMQRRQLEAVIREHENWTMADIYVDVDAYRARAPERQSFRRMLQDCQTGNVDLILISDFSRLSRNTQECAQLICQFHDMDIEVYCGKEQLQSMKTVSRICCMDAQQN